MIQQDYKPQTAVSILMQQNYGMQHQLKSGIPLLLLKQKDLLRNSVNLSQSMIGLHVIPFHSSH